MSAEGVGGGAEVAGEANDADGVANPAFCYHAPMARRKDNAGSAGPPIRRGRDRPATWETRIHRYVDVERASGDAALSAYAELYGRVERKLFAEVAAGRSASSLKSQYQKRYGIPARMFNALRVSLEGKVASVKEQQKLRLDGLRGQIGRAEKQIGLAEEQGRLVQGTSQAAPAEEPAIHVVASLETDVFRRPRAAVLWGPGSCGTSSTI